MINSGIKHLSCLGSLQNWVLQIRAMIRNWVFEITPNDSLWLLSILTGSPPWTVSEKSPCCDWRPVNPVAKMRTWVNNLSHSVFLEVLNQIFFYQVVSCFWSQSLQDLCCPGELSTPLNLVSQILTKPQHTPRHCECHAYAVYLFSLFCSL